MVSSSIYYLPFNLFSLTLLFGDLLSFNLVLHPPLQPSQLICGPDKLEVGLDLAGLRSAGLDPFSGNLAARNCSWVRVRDDVVWYEVEATEGACGNTLRVRTCLFCVVSVCIARNSGHL